MLGFVTSMAFNNAFGREGYAAEGLFTWLYWGVRAVFGVVQYTIALLLAFVLLRLLWWSAARLIPPLGRGVAALRHRIIEGMRAAGLWNRSTAAQWLLGTQVVSIGAVCWLFKDLILAYSSFLDTAEPWKLTALQVSDTHVQYRLAFLWLVILMSVAWYQLLKGDTSDSPIDRPTVAAGVGMIAVVLVLFAAPFRVLYHSQFPRADVNGERCFATGQLEGRVLLFCPERPPPRVRVVNASEVRPGAPERVFK
jgi:hypothetical protein